MQKRRAAHLAFSLVALVTAQVAFAGHGHDDDDDEDHHHGRNHKEKFWDGNCMVERKWKHGEYEEKRKCRAPQQVIVQPAATVVYPPWMVVQQGAPVYAAQAVPAVPATGVYRCQSQTVGRVLGGVVGGVLGNQLGSGNTRALATVGGAVVGVLVGGDIGRRIDAGDQGCVGQVLEFAPAGQRVQWVAAGQPVAVVPGQIVARRGSQCRSYTIEQQTPQGWTRTTETACRRPDGVWMAS
jgi:surface antigen